MNINTCLVIEPNLVHYSLSQQFVNIKRNITNITQFNNPTLITYREAPHQLHVACSYVLLLNPDITRRIQGLVFPLWSLANAFNYGVKKFECVVFMVYQRERKGRCFDPTSFPKFVKVCKILTGPSERAGIFPQTRRWLNRNKCWYSGGRFI